MADNATLEILKSIQAGTNANKIALELLSDQIGGLRQDVRMVRTAINDMAALRITTGEVEAIHTDLNRLQRGYIELAARVETVERRG